MAQRPVRSCREKRELASRSRPSRKMPRNNLFDPKKFDASQEYVLTDTSEEEILDSSDSSDSELQLEGPSDSDSESDPYWDLNRDQLLDIIHQRLHTTFPDLDEKELERAVATALQKGGELADEYCGATPKDISWKIGLPPEDIRELQPELALLRARINASAPSIPKILRSGLSLPDKEYALQLYDALQNCEPYTMCYLKLRQQLVDLIHPPDPRIASLRMAMAEATPTLEKIVSARIPKSDAIRAMQLYDAYKQCPEYTEEWYGLQKRIQTILDAQLESTDAVLEMEAKEQSFRSVQSCDVHAIRRRIFDLDADPQIKSILYEMYMDMQHRDSTDARYGDLRDKILWALRLPYRKQIGFATQNIPEMCQQVFLRLDADIYGMREAKERIVQSVHDQLHGARAGTILALKGSPGVGKTKLAATIAAAIGRPFGKISLGGTIDSTIFKGSDKVWSGATPSLLLQTLARVGCANAIILLDEIDKLAVSEKGLEVQHALLHILDPTQNQEVQDAYLNEFPHDFSHIWFICALNDDAQMDPALRDRLRIIEIPSYSKSDLIAIMQQFTLPAALTRCGCQPGDIILTEEAAEAVLAQIGKEWTTSGLRPIERVVDDIVSKISLWRSMKDCAAMLSYSLPDFHGFPYSIPPEVIRKLVPTATTGSALSYYI